MGNGYSHLKEYNTVSCASTESRNETTYSKIQRMVEMWGPSSVHMYIEDQSRSHKRFPSAKFLANRAITYLIF